MADEAASIAEEAADIAEVAALLSAGGVVEGAGVVVVAGGVVVVVVVVSSFLLQAAKEIAAARVTISNAVFMFLLYFKFDSYRKFWELSLEEPQHPQDLESAEHFQCLACNYRSLGAFPRVRGS